MDNPTMKIDDIPRARVPGIWPTSIEAVERSPDMAILKALEEGP
jgi:hypothetical protein